MMEKSAIKCTSPAPDMTRRELVRRLMVGTVGLRRLMVGTVGLGAMNAIPLLVEARINDRKRELAAKRYFDIMLKDQLYVEMIARKFGTGRSEVTAPRILESYEARISSVADQLSKDPKVGRLSELSKKTRLMKPEEAEFKEGEKALYAGFWQIAYGKMGMKSDAGSDVVQSVLGRTWECTGSAVTFFDVARRLGIRAYISAVQTLDVAMTRGSLLPGHMLSGTKNFHFEALDSEKLNYYPISELKKKYWIVHATFQDPELLEAGAYSLLASVSLPKDTQRKVGLMTKAISIMPTPMFYVNRGMTYMNAGQLDMALADMDRAIRLDRRDVDAHYAKGLALASKRQFDAAIASFENVIREVPNTYGAHINQGNCHMLKGGWANAIKCYEKAVNLAPENYNARTSLASAFLANHEPDGALPQINAAIRINPSNPYSYELLEKAYRMKKAS